MAYKNFVKYLILITIAMICSVSLAQNNVPLGIHYQAVARDNYGNELVNRKISVKFSILSDNPEGIVVYQEVHQDIITSKFGVFSIIIGHGIPTGDTPFGELSQIEWDKAFHFLKVEVKFENAYMDMGTMQFLAVPYALYAQRSLEPGPPGPKGDPGPKGEEGDPASDNQTLSVINIDGSDYLSISGGNGVKISSIERDGDPANEIQDLVINSNKLKITKNTVATEWDLTKYLDNTDNQAITYDAATRVLGISGNALTINLSELKDDADADPGNEIQDLVYDNAKKELRITKSTAPVIDLSDLKNDADADPTNEIQDLQLSGNTLGITKNASSTGVDLSKYLDDTDNQGLTYTESTNTLSITNGTPVTLGRMVAFRAKKEVSETVPTFMTDYDFTTNPPIYNDGNGFDNLTGVFTAPLAGIYTFNVNYTAVGSADSRILKIYLNGSFYETLNSGITNGSTITRQTTMKLAAGNTVKVIINVGTGFETGIGSFSGFKVY